MNRLSRALRTPGAYIKSKVWARRAATVLVPVGLVLAGSISPAMALGSSTDLTGGAGDTFFTTIENYFKQHVIASVLVLLALTLGVSMLIGWGKKGAKAK